MDLSVGGRGERITCATRHAHVRNVVVQVQGGVVGKSTQACEGKKRRGGGGCQGRSDRASKGLPIIWVEGVGFAGGWGPNTR